MKIVLLTILILILSMPLHAQNNALILNNGVVMSISGGAVLTINQTNPAGIVTSGAGTSYIQSEGELNRIAWNIDNSTGNYLIPFGVSGTRIDASYNITTAGSVPGTLIASTYATAANNTSFPATAPAVTNVEACYPSGACQNRSLYAVDRFLVIRKSNWATNPVSNLTFSYRDAEFAAPNTITETNLGAQYWDVNQWRPGWFTGPAPLGTADAANNQVTGIDAASNGNFYTWILVDKSNPLPVSLTEFVAVCSSSVPIVSWATASESNNSHFTLERSFDGYHWETAAIVSGAGNSNTSLFYQISDAHASEGVNYYRLWQQDFDGKSEMLGNIQVNCNQSQNAANYNLNVYGDNIHQIHITFTNEREEDFVLQLFDIRGRLVAEQKTVSNPGLNHVVINNFPLSDAAYMFVLTSPSTSVSKKIFMQ